MYELAKRGNDDTFNTEEVPGLPRLDAYFMRWT